MRYCTAAILQGAPLGGTREPSPQRVNNEMRWLPKLKELKELKDTRSICLGEGRTCLKQCGAPPHSLQDILCKCESLSEDNISLSRHAARYAAAMKYGQEYASTLKGTSAEFQQASINCK